MQARFNSIMPIADRPDCVFVQGRGSWLYDEQGKAYLDFVQGWAVNTLGHGHTAVVEAIQRQAERLINPSPGYYNAPALRLADLLVAHSAFDQVFFANSGAEANEGAIKLARKWGTLHKHSAHKIITFDDGFHGRTLATMAASGKPGWEDLFAPRMPGFVRVPYNNLDVVSKAVDRETVAVMLEPIQGEAGVIPAEPDFLQGLRELTRRSNLLLIFDEVQTGMGRTGDLFAYLGYGVEPDIMTLGKGIGGGVPLAALLTTSSVSCFAHGDQGGTYNGNPLVTAAGVAVLETILQPGFMADVRRRADYLRNRLERLSADYGLGVVRGRGLLLALDTGRLDAATLAKQAFAAGLLINAPRPSTLRFMPALTVSEEDIDRMADRLGQLLANAAARENG